jgi:hypothetical protein
MDTALNRRDITHSPRPQMLITLSRAIASGMGYANKCNISLFDIFMGTTK